MNVEEIPDKLIDEVLIYLYSNNLCKYSDFKQISHSNFVIEPVPIIKGLFDKAKFYNTCFQKLFMFLLLNKDVLNRIVDKFQFNEKIQRFIDISRKERNDKFATPEILFNTNEFTVDKFKKFVYIYGSSLYPSNIYQKDNFFYNCFYNKYPNFFPKIVNEFEVLYNRPLSEINRLSSEDELTSAYDRILTIFMDQFNYFRKVVNKDVYKLKKEMKNVVENENPEDVVNNNNDPIIDEIDNSVQPIEKSKCYVVFVCKENEEEDIIDQGRFIENLHSKYAITVTRLNLNNLRALISEGVLRKDEYNNVFMNDLVVGIFHFKIDILTISSEFLDTYEFIETSTAVKMPNVHAVLMNLIPVYNEIIDVSTLRIVYKDEELINELSRFCLNNNNSNDNYYAFNWKKYYNSDMKEISNFINLKESEDNSTIKLSKIDKPEFSSVVVKNNSFTKETLVSNIEVLSFSIVQGKRIVENRNIGCNLKSFKASENSLLFNPSEKECYYGSLLLLDINLRDIKEINYNKI